MRKMLSSRALRRATVFLAIALNFALLSDGFAQTGKTAGNAQVPIDFLKKMRPRSGLRTPITTQAATLASVPNIDSLANWTDQFSASGFDFNGNPQDIWPYSMVGAPPESGRTTVIRAPIIPVTVQLLGPGGRVATFNGVPLILSVTPDITKAVLNSPIFQPWIYTSGIGQINDQEMRAQFWDRIHRGGSDNGWHTLLAPTVRKTRVMQIPSGFWFFAPNADGSCCAFALVDSTTFGNLLFPSTAPPDNSTPIGAAENAGDMTTQDLSTLLFNNVFLYDGTPDNCCVLGFHSYDLEPGDKHNGNREKAKALSPELQTALEPLLAGIESLSEQIREYNERIEKLAQQSYPQVALLKQVKGVGTLIALTFLLTLEDAHRFRQSRDVGCYLGLQPGRRNSGQSEPQMHISKEGDPYLRTLLVQGAHHVLGPFGADSDLRRWGLKLAERGGKSGKKRAIIAVARKLAVLFHRLWVSGEVYEPLRKNCPLVATAA